MRRASALLACLALAGTVRAQSISGNNGGIQGNSGVASSGSVSSVTATGGTLTISPNTGPVFAGINLGNANTWTALQSFAAHLAGAGTAPTITNGTPDGRCTDLACTVTETGTVTSSTITFNVAFNGAHCTVSSPNGSQFQSYTQTPTTALTITHLSASGSKWTVQCID